MRGDLWLEEDARFFFCVLFFIYLFIFSPGPYHLSPVIIVNVFGGVK